ncbi:MAG: hypothetical protein AABX05_01885 [Nanoarchaeota archaeon]
MEKYCISVRDGSGSIELILGKITAVYDVLNERGKPLFTFIKGDSSADGTITEIFEIGAEGIVIYQKQGYHKIDYSLLSFSPQSEFYKQFTGLLEEVVKESSISLQKR